MNKWINKTKKIDYAWQNILIKNYAILRIESPRKCDFFALVSLGPWVKIWLTVINYNVKEPEPKWIWWKIIWRNESQRKWTNFVAVVFFFVYYLKGGGKIGGYKMCGAQILFADVICRFVGFSLGSRIESEKNVVRWQCLRFHFHFHFAISLLPAACTCHCWLLLLFFVCIFVSSSLLFASLYTSCFLLLLRSSHILRCSLNNIRY